MTMHLCGTEADHMFCKVTDYLLKRGYNRTEEIFRKENMNLGPDGRPQHKSTEEMGFKKYSKAFRLLKRFVDGNLDYYKVSILGRFRMLD